MSVSLNTPIVQAVRNVSPAIMNYVAGCFRAGKGRFKVNSVMLFLEFNGAMRIVKIVGCSEEDNILYIEGESNHD